MTLMRARPYYDPDSAYFTTTFDLECRCLDAHRQLVRSIVEVMMEEERNHLGHIWEGRTQRGEKSLLEKCPHFRGWYVQASMELGPEDVSLLERCPHFRGWYVQASMELGPEDVSLLERCPHFRGWYVQASMELGPEDVSLLERCPHFILTASDQVFGLGLPPSPSHPVSLTGHKSLLPPSSLLEVTSSLSTLSSLPPSLHTALTKLVCSTLA